MNPAPVLVTGAAGFIGARFVASCNARKVPVISVDTESLFKSREEHASVDFGKTVDRDRLFDFLRNDKPALSGIVHLGACADTTEMDLAFLQRVNVEYSQKLWNHAIANRLNFVYASSAATYGAGDEGYEDDETRIGNLKPLNPYGQSKQDFDVWALDEEKSGRKPPAWSGFKFFNVYGFGERHKQKMASVVLHAFDQIWAENKVRLFRSHKAGIADGHQKRDFVYVNDVIDVLWFALERPLPRGIYNLGSGKARTFLELTQAAFRALGVPEKIEFIDTPVSIRDRYQYFTEARMGRLRAAGYTKPFTSLEDGVRSYIAELKKFS